MTDNIRRYKDAILFKKPGKIPLYPGHPRESTLAAWHSQGLPENADYAKAATAELGISPDAMLSFYAIGASFKMVPEFEPEILEHKDGHYVIRDWMGAVTEISDKYDYSYLYEAKDFVTRKWHRFPVENRGDWEQMKARYVASEPARIAPGEAERCAAMMRLGQVPSLNFNGVFWQLREWCGFENLCMLMAEDPEFVADMAGFWSDFVSAMLERVFAELTPVRVFISEDMAYKAHSMISPAMTRKFIIPAYKRWVSIIKSGGCGIIEIDSDGYIEELIPLWVEAGINCCSPLEVAAHCDIVKFRQKFGRGMAFMQGIDKRIIARGGRELADHVMGIVPALFKDGGYIPGCDHGVPPDISWPNYLEFTRMVAKLSGWL